MPLPQPKDTLKSGLSLPRKIEASLPASAPKLSEVLAAGINAMPTLPMPSLPGTTGARPRVREFIKSLESNLPSGLPSLDRAAKAIDGAGGSKIQVGIGDSAKTTTVPVLKIGV